MIAYYISNVQYASIIEKNEVIMEANVIERANFSELVRTNLQKWQIPDLVFDLHSFTDEEEEILNALKSLRMVYDDKKIILICQGFGNSFISKLIDIGIYNIVADENEIEQELEFCLKYEKKYKDVIHLQQNELAVEQKKVKEKVIVKERVVQVQKLKNEMIGVTSYLEKAGVTTHAIYLANNLRRQGYKVALLEVNHHHYGLSCLKDYYEFEGEEYFSNEKVDYYPNFDIKNISSVYEKGYEVIIVDFGILQKEQYTDLLKCTKRIFIAKSQPYELELLGDFFEEVQESVIQKFDFVFQDTNEFLKNLIKENMQKDVYFMPLILDYFHDNFNEDMNLLYKDYLNQKIEKKKEGHWDWDCLKEKVIAKLSCIVKK